MCAIQWQVQEVTAGGLAVLRRMTRVNGKLFAALPHVTRALRVAPGASSVSPQTEEDALAVLTNLV